MVKCGQMYSRRSVAETESHHLSPEGRPGDTHDAGRLGLAASDLRENRLDVVLLEFPVGPSLSVLPCEERRSFSLQGDPASDSL